MNPVMVESPWYKDGLSFDCTQCGNCCSGASGYVWATEDERRRMAEFLQLKPEEFDSRYARRIGFRYTLKEKKRGESLDCVFLQEQKGKRVCGIYPVRPIQCRTWPFWDENLKTPESWNLTAEHCPGINRGTHHDFVQIEILRTRHF